ncbi:GPP34 family phosphoprotein [Sphaerisporangium sp. TRM90804]|uniref:GOLPH3/VPS74 family protein n=1 Tax=Sphaerisporangium sp. TRM90804 TaxID=3031113 RepID=UPI00244D2E33|nr:GPP34 family phosphoprotein [Sphaerisporangium sp. TRM90804]MDH2424221.1 GPP34 family phosphoprotein [Sphaerisporangium sp. TRM90804]
MDLPPTLPERLYLLAYDTSRGRLTGRMQLGLVIRAGILGELLIQGHIKDATGGPSVTTGALADPMLDAVLQQIAASRRRSWQHWVSRGGGKGVRAVRDRLEAGRWIRVEHRRILGLFPSTKVTVRDTRVVKHLVATATAALRGGVPITRLHQRDAALAALAGMARMRTVLPGKEWRAKRRRVDDLAESIAPVPRALRKAIAAAEAAAAAG